MRVWECSVEDMTEAFMRHSTLLIRGNVKCIEVALSSRKVKNFLFRTSISYALITSGFNQEFHFRPVRNP